MQLPATLIQNLQKLYNEVRDRQEDLIRTNAQFGGIGAMTLDLEPEVEAVATVKRYIEDAFNREGNLDGMNFDFSIRELEEFGKLSKEYSGEALQNALAEFRSSDIRDLVQKIYDGAKEIFSGEKAKQVGGSIAEASAAPKPAEVFSTLIREVESYQVKPQQQKD